MKSQPTTGVRDEAGEVLRRHLDVSARMREQRRPRQPRIDTRTGCNRQPKWNRHSHVDSLPPQEDHPASAYGNVLRDQHGLAATATAAAAALPRIRWNRHWNGTDIGEPTLEWNRQYGADTKLSATPGSHQAAHCSAT